MVNRVKAIGITDDPDPAFGAKENERFVKELYETAEVIDIFMFAFLGNEIIRLWLIIRNWHINNVNTIASLIDRTLRTRRYSMTNSHYRRSQ